MRLPSAPTKRWPTSANLMTGWQAAIDACFRLIGVPPALASGHPMFPDENVYLRRCLLKEVTAHGSFGIELVDWHVLRFGHPFPGCGQQCRFKRAVAVLLGDVIDH